MTRLRAEGHEVDYVAEIRPSASDDDVLGLSTSRKALLLTADKDFGELVFRLGRAHHGVILVRLSGLPPEDKAETVSAALRSHSQELEGAFSVLEPNRIRIRSSR